MSLLQVLQVPFAPSYYGSSSGVLLQSLTSANQAGSLGLVADDEIAIQLFPRAITSIIGATASTLQLSSGSSIVFSIKSDAGLGGETLLGQATGFTEYQDGNGNWYYGSVLELTAEAVAAALGSQSSIACRGEILITDVTGSKLRYQFDITLYEAVYTGDEDEVSTPEPGAALNFLLGSQAISNGVDQVTVTGLALAVAPALIIAQVVKTDGTKANIDTFLRAGWTTDGFTVDLSSLTTDGTFVLNWIIVPSSGSVGSIAVPANVDTLTVPLTLPTSPTLVVPILVKSAGGEANIRAFLRAGWGGAGFTVDFSALTPDNTYVLYYLLTP